MPELTHLKMLMPRRFRPRRGNLPLHLELTQPNAPTAAEPVISADGPSSVAADSSMPAGDVPADSHKHETEHEASGSSPKRAHMETFPTPRDAEHEVLDDSPFERMMSPEKSPKRDGDGI